MSKYKFTQYEIKNVILDLAHYHKDTCNDPECDITPQIIIEIMEHLGIELNKNELKILS